MEKKILIVEDDNFYAQYLNLLFAKFYPDYTVYRAETVLQAWRILLQHDWDKRFDLVLLDLQLPKINGIGLVKLIEKRLEKLGKSPQVIVNSNYPLREMIKYFSTSDVTPLFFKKPMHISKLKDFLYSAA